MSRSFDDIVRIYRERRQRHQPLIAKMYDLRDAYNGDVTVPTPELDRLDTATVANVIALSLDQNAMRVASTRPDVLYPPLRPGIQRSENLARQRKLANLSWWAMNRMERKLRYRARTLLGYGTAPVMLRPDYRREIPEWFIRSPFTTYPCPMPNADDMCPDDCIFTYTQSLGWLLSEYPSQAAALNKGPEPRPDDRYEMIEYVDADDIVLGVLGSDRYAADVPYGPPVAKGAAYMELDRIPNRAGVCTAVVPGRITLDRLQGQYDNVIGMYKYQAALMALDYQAVKKSVYPNEWVEPLSAGTNAEIMTMADGMIGQIGRIKNGKMNVTQLNPGVQTGPMLDRIERNIRVTSGSPPELGGESVSNVRTGKRGDSILSAVLDFPIQENQETFAGALEEENKRAIAIAKGYWGSKQYSFYVPAKWARRNDTVVDYTPNEAFENDNNVVSFANAGVDAANSAVVNGQKVGIGEMSKRTMRIQDPAIEDPELEHDWIVSEALEQAVLQALQTQASTGAISPTDIARISQLVRSNKMELEDAIDKVQKEAQARQATSGAPGSPEAPVDPNSPEAQPGIAQPGAGAEAGVSVPPPSASQQNLSYLLGDLSRGARVAKQVA